VGFIVLNNFLIFEWNLRTKTDNTPKKSPCLAEVAFIVLIHLEDDGLSTLYPTLKYSINHIIAYKKLLVNTQVNFKMSHWYNYRSVAILLSISRISSLINTDKTPYLEVTSATFF